MFRPLRMPTLSELGLQRLWPDLARRCYRHRQFVTIAYVTDLAVKIDFNTWIKHKYRKCYSEVSDADRVYFRHTRAEKILRAIKRACRAPMLRAGSGAMARRYVSGWMPQSQCRQSFDPVWYAGCAP